MDLPELLTLSAVLGTGGLAALVVWRRPPEPLWPLLLFVCLCPVVWGVGEFAASFLVRDPAWHRFWIAVLYTGVLANQPVWWLFALRFSEFHGRPISWAGPTVQYGPLVLAGIFWLAMVTNPWHETFMVVTLGERSQYRLGWLLHAGMAYVLILGAGTLFLRLRLLLPRLPLRRQLNFMLVASVLPLTANLIYVTGLGPSEFDPTVSVFSASVLLFLIGIYRDRLFALSPIPLRQLIRRDPAGLVLLDSARRVLLSNPTARDLFDSGELRFGSAILPSIAGRLTLPDDPQVEVDPELLWERLTGREQPPDGHLFGFQHPTWRWIQLKATSIQGRWGSPRATALHLRDVTALRKATEVMGEQAAALEAILGATDNGLLVVDNDGSMIYFNRVAQRMWRLPDDLRAHADDETALAYVMNQLADPEEFRKRVQELYADPWAEAVDEILFADGRIFERSTRPLVREETVIGRVWVFRDLTEQRREEDERRRLDLHMQEAQKLESLGILAGGIAHDFNNLLVAIQGNVELALLKLPEDSTLRPLLMDVQDGAVRASELTEQMLAYAGKGKYVTEAVDLSRLVEQTAHLLEAVVSKKASLEYAFEGAPVVEGDPTRLRQVVMNLITNASDALTDGEGTIRVVTAVCELDAKDLTRSLHGENLRPGRYAMAEVSDSGEGMDDETVERIFEPFFTTKHAGRGLGLSAVLGIVRSHGGAIEVESRRGVGTKFRILIPASENLAAAPEEPTAQLTESWRGQGTVLVVDDEPQVRATVRRMLERCGFEVLTAADGIDAVSVFRTQAEAITVVLLDMTMPRMDGAEAAQELHRIRSDTPLILMSGFPEQDAEQRFAGIKVAGFLRKPYGMKDLIHVLRSAVDPPPTPPRRA